MFGNSFFKSAANSDLPGISGSTAAGSGPARIAKAPAAGFGPARIAIAAAAAFGLFAGATTWTARADDAPQSPNTVQLAATTAPHVPANVTAEAGEKKALVKWEAPEAGNDEVIAFLVVGSPTGIAIVNGQAREARVGNLSNGTAYTFKVAAINRIGMSEFSGPSAAVTPGPKPLTLPGAPLNVVATAGNGKALVKWDDPAGAAENKIFAYIVVGEPTGASVAGGDANRAVVGHLANGTAYRFKVAAVNPVGIGPYSELSAPVTPSQDAVLATADADDDSGKDKKKPEAANNGRGNDKKEAPGQGNGLALGIAKKAAAGQGQDMKEAQAEVKLDRLAEKLKEEKAKLQERFDADVAKLKARIAASASGTPNSQATGGDALNSEQGLSALADLQKKLKSRLEDLEARYQKQIEQTKEKIDD